MLDHFKQSFLCLKVLIRGHESTLKWSYFLCVFPIKSTLGRILVLKTVVFFFLHIQHTS